MNRSAFGGVLVIGGGLAGMMTALRLEKYGVAVCLAGSSSPQDSSSYHAQGGIAAALPDMEESPEEHIQDTLRAGAGLCDEHVVRRIVGAAPEAIVLLEHYGVMFDRRSDRYDLHREGGHRHHRVLHVADRTGAAIVQSLRKEVLASSVNVLDGWEMISLLTEANRVVGAGFTNGEREIRIHASQVVLATGGLGGMYATSTNPPSLWGAGIASAMEAGAKVANLGFVQFHPTAMYSSESGRSPLVSEAVRGAGGILRNAAGEAFMTRYHPDADMATRDVVADSIAGEMKRDKRPFVHLDISSIDAFSEHFPSIHAERMRRGYVNNLIPVAPAAHYACGGIVVDESGQTNVSGLSAVGECACTGLHGANRLASNSLLEAVVCSDRLAVGLKGIPGTPVASDGNNETSASVLSSVDINTIAELKSEMSRYMGVRKNRAILEVLRSEWYERSLVETALPVKRRFALASAMAKDALQYDHSIGGLKWEQETRGIGRSESSQSPHS